MHYGFSGFGGFGMIFFWIFVIVAVVVLIRALTCSVQSRKSRDKTPLDILKERYAAGEINHDEFISRKNDLVGH